MNENVQPELKPPQREIRVVQSEFSVIDEFLTSTNHQLKRINTLEYALLAAVPLAILYLTCAQYRFKKKHPSKKAENTITDINALMKNLNAEETTVAGKIAVRKERIEQLTFLKQALFTVALFLGFWCYRTPPMFHYFVSEVPQLSITLPIATFLVI